MVRQVVAALVMGIALAGCTDAGSDSEPVARATPEAFVAYAESVDKSEAEFASETAELDGVSAVLWRNDGAPVKLREPVPDDAGTFSGETLYYFEDGRLVLVREPYAQYGFEDGEMMYWVDEHGRPSEVSSAEFAERAQNLKERARDLLGRFDEG